MGVARVLDWDGTITDNTEGTLLERFLYDFYDSRVGAKKTELALRSFLVRGYQTFAKSAGKLFEKEITGETTTFDVLEILVLRKSMIPFSFLRNRAKEYARLVIPAYVNAIKSCKEPVYIVSSEPIQMIQAILDELGLSEKVSGVYGTKFEVQDGKILGFDRLHLYAGTRGKYIGMEKIASNGYNKILAIGDSSADKGLFKAHKDKVVPFTINGASNELIEYVLENNGFVVENLVEFFDFDASA